MSGVEQKKQFTNPIWFRASCKLLNACECAHKSVTTVKNKCWKTSEQHLCWVECFHFEFFHSHFEHALFASLVGWLDGWMLCFFFNCTLIISKILYLIFIVISGRGGVVVMGQPLLKIKYSYTVNCNGVKVATQRQTDKFNLNSEHARTTYKRMVKNQRVLFAQSRKSWKIKKKAYRRSNGRRTKEKFM